MRMKSKPHPRPVPRLPLIILFMGLSGATLPAEPLALHDGEQMTFRVGWGLFTGAGEIKIFARRESLAGLPQLRVITTTSTRGILKAFYPFRARSEAVFDIQTGRLLMSQETSASKRKETRQSLVFDYPHRTARYMNAVEPQKNATLALPPGDPMDLIMSLVETRNWNLQPGQQHDALVIFDNEFYALTLHAEGYENLRTPLGDFKTLVLVPRMEKTEPKGMFKHGSTVRVWISQDARHLPVRFQVEFKFGAGVATLVDYQPPAAPPADRSR
jgi:hypothetical protein